MKKHNKAKMKLPNRCRFVLDMLTDRLKLFLMVVIMGTVSFGLIDVCLMMLLESRQTYLLADALFSVDKEFVYKVRDMDVMNMLDMANENQFQKELVQSDVWRELSAYTYSEEYAFAVLKDNPDYRRLMAGSYAGTVMEKLWYSDNQQPGDYMLFATINENARELFDIGICGNTEILKDEDGNNMVPVYAGSRLQGIVEQGQVLGTIDCFYADDEETYIPVSCYVAGFIPQGALILADGYQGQSDIAVGLDIMLLVCCEDVFAAGYEMNAYNLTKNVYAAAKPEELPRVRSQLLRLYEKYGKKLDLCTVTQMMDENNEWNQSLMLMFAVAVILMVSGFLAFTTTSIISVLLKQRQYGIMLANGVSHRDLKAMLAMETALKYVMSAVAAFCIMHAVYLSEATYVYTGVNYHMTYLHMHWQYALPVLLLICTAGIVFSAWIPARMIDRLNAMELLRQV